MVTPALCHLPWFSCGWTPFCSIDFFNVQRAVYFSYFVINDHGYVPLVINTSRPFPHSWLNTGVVTRVTRRVPLVEQELLTLPEHMNSPPVFSGVRVARSLVFGVVFCRSLFFFSFLSLCCLSCDLRIRITPLVSLNSSFRTYRT